MVTLARRVLLVVKRVKMYAKIRGPRWMNVMDIILEVFVFIHQSDILVRDYKCVVSYTLQRERERERELSKRRSSLLQHVAES